MTPRRQTLRALAVAALLCPFGWWGAPAARAGGDAGFGVSDEAARRALAQRDLRTLDGRDMSLATQRGQVVVLNFWASWCGPCRKELRVLDALNREITRSGGRVVAVSIDQDPENVRRFVRSLRLGMPIVHDGPAGLARALDLDHVPFTVILDRDGAVAFTTSHSDRETLAKIGTITRTLLAKSPVAARSTEGDSR
jgi:thiol-disulfide isomerase/thioredoxin